MQCWYGIDVGGTKIELVAYDATLRELHRERVTTPTQDYDTFLQAITGLVHSADMMLAADRVEAGVWVPASVSTAELQNRGNYVRSPQAANKQKPA